MTKRLRHKEAGDAVVLYPDNYINDIEGERIEDLCDLFIGRGFKRILIDFSSTDLINSIGVSILIGIIEKVREKKGVIAFSSLKHVNIEIFKIVGLTDHVQVYGSEEEALSPAGQTLTL
jgi:anti-anti-sigma factor